MPKRVAMSQPWIKLVEKGHLYCAILELFFLHFWYIFFVHFPTLLKAILRFCITNKLFKYFRRRYNDDQLKDLNNVVKIRGKIRTLQLSNAFLKECTTKRVSPRYTKWICLLMFQASKKAPPPLLRNPGYATAQDKGKMQLSNTLRVKPWKIFEMKMGHG